MSMLSHFNKCRAEVLINTAAHHSPLLVVLIRNSRIDLGLPIDIVKILGGIRTVMKIKHLS
jgi:hypothetical protein